MFHPWSEETNFFCISQRKQQFKTFHHPSETSFFKCDCSLKSSRFTTLWLTQNPVFYGLKMIFSLCARRQKHIPGWLGPIMRLLSSVSEKNLIDGMSFFHLWCAFKKKENRKNFSQRNKEHRNFSSGQFFWCKFWSHVITFLMRLRLHQDVMECFWWLIFTGETPEVLHFHRDNVLFRHESCRKESKSSRL